MYIGLSEVNKKSLRQRQKCRITVDCLTRCGLAPLNYGTDCLNPCLIHTQENNGSGPLRSEFVSLCQALARTIPQLYTL